MFTGIVTDIGTVVESRDRGDRRIVVRCAYDLDDVMTGASIACSGTCLTVVDKGADWFAVDLSRESLLRTARGLWDEGSRLNLERALKVGDELGGHIVTGHVDGVGTVLSVDADGASHRIGVGVPDAIAPYLAPKGSICLDGVSLTVNAVHDGDGTGGTRFEVNVIPHSWTATTLSSLVPGREVNLEIDVLARYLQRMRAYGAIARSP
ncbi:riboflavin synthase [Nostoc sp. CHAB 5714]|uniref:Riboflavin synthase n=1 Tax=Nostoc favosum CHAB5714 TaxID=2780399 RepID=A0ABS8ILS9_9NOSO|nr:riboflavin synthase [Nostoc favosum CHAB5714]